MRFTLAVVIALLLPAGAQAQAPDAPASTAGRRLTLGGEATVIAGEKDGRAFFNYTDYEHNGLRLTRVRLLAEWRLHDRVSALGEVRVENKDRADVAALYVRWQPWAHREFTIQAGRIPPVIGTFGRRAYGRDNPVIGSPLAYQYLTSLRPNALPATVDDVLRMRGRGWLSNFPLGSPDPGPGVALVSAFQWDTGVQVAWTHRWLVLAGALTRGAPARPVIRDTTEGLAWSGRASVVVPAGISIGVSGARGRWIDNDAMAMVPGPRLTDSGQGVVGFDAEIARGHWLVRTEWLRSTFALPNLATPLSATSVFADARYRFHPRWQIAGRVDRLGFSRVTGTLFGGVATPWDAPVKRIEGALGFRATRTIEVRAGWQRNWREAGRIRRKDFPALQVMWWF